MRAVVNAASRSQSVMCSVAIVSAFSLCPLPRPRGTSRSNVAQKLEREEIRCKRTYKIAAVPGDGIGKETVPEGLRVLEAAATRFGFTLQTTDYDWSCERYAQTGAMMPEDGLDQLARSTTRCSSAPSAGPACPTTSRSGAC